MSDMQLYQAYFDILKDVNPAFFDKKSINNLNYSGFSGLFVSSTPDIWEAGKRIMVIGRETRGWKIIDNDHPYISLDDYISRAMQVQKNFLAEYIETKRDRKSSFFNFLRDVASIVGTGNVAWANLFCCDWKKSIPTKKNTTHYDDILKISESLLKKQIEILSPDIIIFANGVSSAKIRRKYFPLDGEKKVCRDIEKYDDFNMPDIELISFTLNEKIKCYRINHPSNWTKPAREARKFLMRLIKNDIL